jgi:hypothetical protein
MFSSYFNGRDLQVLTADSDALHVQHEEGESPPQFEIQGLLTKNTFFHP